jgi:GxxExxY protein
MTELLHKELTGEIIGVYYDVYNALGCTYTEFVYERAMSLDLREKGYTCRQQVEYQVFYKEKLVGIQRLDLLVADIIVIEIKVAPEITRLHKAQALSYLKTSGKQVGMLLNFGASNPGFERLYYQDSKIINQNPEHPPQSKDWPGEYLYPELTEQVIGAIFEVHTNLGPGFIHRIYANALYHELALSGLEVLPRREYQVMYRGKSIGEIKLNHLQVDDRMMVFPVAIQDLNDLNFKNLKEWLQTQEIKLGIIANFCTSSVTFRALRL